MIFEEKQKSQPIEKYHPEVKFERYADDIIIHCQHFKQACGHWKR